MRNHVVFILAYVIVVLIADFNLGRFADESGPLFARCQLCLHLCLSSFLRLSNCDKQLSLRTE